LAFSPADLQSDEKGGEHVDVSNLYSTSSAYLSGTRKLSIFKDLALLIFQQRAIASIRIYENLETKFIFSDLYSDIL
jgi:hypothetical protein